LDLIATIKMLKFNNLNRISPGKDSALDAAHSLEQEGNRQYGMVSAELKKDRRTVEDIQAELRAKKRQKLE